MARFYSDPSRERETWALPNFEAFEVKADEFSAAFVSNDGTWMADNMASELDGYAPDEDISGRAQELAGWYYWPCFPGCMPDGDATGPFESEEAAIADARDNYGEE